MRCKLDVRTHCSAGHGLVFGGDLANRVHISAKHVILLGARYLNRRKTSQFFFNISNFAYNFPLFTVSFPFLFC